MKKLLPLLVLLLFAGPLARAAEVRVCPPWKIEVVDAKGTPMAGCTVFQEWSANYGPVCPIQATNAVSDAAGIVTFPERWLGPPTNQTVRQKITGALSAHGDPVPSANIYIWKKGYEPVRVYSERDPNVTATIAGLRSRITLRPEPAPK